MNLIFLGTPAFAIPTLRCLAQTRHKIVAVLTQPDQPQGRGMRLMPPPVKTVAHELGLLVMQPEKASSSATLEKIRELRPDAAVVVAYGRILKRDFLELPPHGCVNLHPSLLPRYRGPTPIQSAILAGEKTTGVTTMLLDEGMDTGPILLQREVEISDDDTAGTLHDKLAEAGAELMVETLDAMDAQSLTPRPQNNAEATITLKLDKKDGVLDWTKPTESICNLTRAFDPWPGCQTTYRDEVLKIWRIEPYNMQARTGTPGEVLIAEGSDFIVQARDGAVRIVELQAPGKKRMSAQEFLRGHPIAVGTILGLRH